MPDYIFSERALGRAEWAAGRFNGRAGSDPELLFESPNPVAGDAQLGLRLVGRRTAEGAFGSAMGE